MKKNAASLKPFRESVQALKFAPGQWQSFEMTGEYLRFYLHVSAQEPVTAEFEVALDNELQDYTLKAVVEEPFRHGMVIGKCDGQRIVTIRRKETDSDTPIFVLALDGAPGCEK